MTKLVERARVMTIMVSAWLLIAMIAMLMINNLLLAALMGLCCFYVTRINRTLEVLSKLAKKKEIFVTK